MPVRRFLFPCRKGLLDARFRLRPLVGFYSYFDYTNLSMLNVHCCLGDAVLNIP